MKPISTAFFLPCKNLPLWPCYLKVSPNPSNSNSSSFTKPHSWASLLSSNATYPTHDFVHQKGSNVVIENQSRMPLRFFDPVKDTISDNWVIPTNSSRKWELRWENTLIGCFTDKRLPFNIIMPRIQKHWEGYGLIDVQTNKKGFLYFFVLF